MSGAELLEHFRTRATPRFFAGFDEAEHEGGRVGNAAGSDESAREAREVLAHRWPLLGYGALDRKSTRLNSSHANISYAVFCLKKQKLLTAHAVADRLRADRCHNRSEHDRLSVHLARVHNSSGDPVYRESRRSDRTRDVTFGQT